MKQTGILSKRNNWEMQSIHENLPFDENNKQLSNFWPKSVESVGTKTYAAQV